MATPEELLQRQIGLSQGGTPTAQDVISLGLSEGTPRPIARAPGLFDQVESGLFSAAGLADPSAGIEAGESAFPGLFGRARKRREEIGDIAQREFTEARDEARGFLERDLGRSLTAQEAAGFNQAVSALGGQGAQAFGQQLQANEPAIVQRRQQLLDQAEAVRLQAVEAAEVQAQTAVTNADRAIVGLQNDRLRGEQIGLEIAQSEEKALRDNRQRLITNQSSFQSDVRQNAALAKGQQALTSFQQLESLFDNPDATALDVQNGIVALAQILEPGLAVRNDDRIAITGGATPGLQRLVQDFNQFVSGDPDLEVTIANMKQSALQLIQPRAASFQEALRFYDGVITPRTPGVQRGDVLGILGLTEDTINTVNRVLSDNPGGRRDLR